jgi:cystathionine beta-lyase/cystathionine gamma-synthase
VEHLYFPGLAYHSCRCSSSPCNTITTEDVAAQQQRQQQQQQAIWERQCTRSGSVITVVVRPDTRRAAYRVLDSLSRPNRSSSTSPRSRTHSDASVDNDSDFLCGIAEGMLRISVGLESSADIIHDLLQALDQIDCMEKEEAEDDDDGFVQ